MSVASKNPFELLGDDGDESPAPSPAPKAVAAPAPASQQPKVVPGAAPKGGRGARYPSRGGPRNVFRGEERPVAEGEESFDGERVAPPKKHHQGRDAHTKGPREDRTNTGPRSRAPGASRGPKVPSQYGERRAFERRQGGQGEAQKKTEEYGTDEGKADLSAEVQGETDAQVEGTGLTTPAVEESAVEEAPETPAEPEDTSKTYDQYLAELAEKALSNDLGKKEVRQVSAETLEGKAFVRESLDEFFTGKAKAVAPKEKAPKKEKVYIEVDGQFATPAGRPPRADRPERGDRPARGRGAPRGSARGSATRGGPRGGARPARSQAAPVDANDERAFPALGA